MAGGGHRALVARAARRPSFCSATRRCTGRIIMRSCSRGCLRGFAPARPWRCRCRTISRRRRIGRSKRRCSRARWHARLGALLRPAPVAPAEDYFRWLSPHAASLDIWTTEYLHVLAPMQGGDHPVVAWMRGTALTPYLSHLDSAAQREFVADLESAGCAGVPGTGGRAGAVRIPAPLHRRHARQSVRPPGRPAWRPRFRRDGSAC